MTTRKPDKGVAHIELRALYQVAQLAGFTKIKRQVMKRRLYAKVALPSRLGRTVLVTVREIHKEVSLSW